MDAKKLQPESIAAQALGWIDDKTRAITPPIHVSSTYLRDPDNQYRSGASMRAPTTRPSTRPRP
jgi:cystathionine gamma-synthase